jgi:hypothetical protein
MTCSNITELIELIEKLDTHPCFGLECNGYCKKNCAAGGGFNINLVNFYKNKLIETVRNNYNNKKKLYEEGLSSAEERNDIDDLKRELDNAETQLNNILKLYQV